MASELKEPDFSPVETVVVEGLVVLKILKHCKESLPATATGTLLGMDSDGVVEVTNCFPRPLVADSDDSSTTETGYLF
jgi:translation initiation factor 3 subunit H